MTAQSQIPTIVPTAKDLSTIPIAVLRPGRRGRLSDARPVVPMADDPDPRSGAPLTIQQPVHNEGGPARDLDAYVSLLIRKDLGNSADDLLDEYPAFVICGHLTAQRR